MWSISTCPWSSGPSRGSSSARDCGGGRVALRSDDGLSGGEGRGWGWKQRQRNPVRRQACQPQVGREAAGELSRGVGTLSHPGERQRSAACRRKQHSSHPSFPRQPRPVRHPPPTLLTASHTWEVAPTTTAPPSPCPPSAPPAPSERGQSRLQAVGWLEGAGNH